MINRALVREWVDRLRSLGHEHEWLLKIEKGLMFLKCQHCDATTPGWDITGRSELD